jgi:type II secretion system protein H
MISPGPHRQQLGFTLFELLVVMALIGIMAALVLPRIGGNDERLRLTTAANDVAAILRYARSQAVTRGTDIDILYSTEKHCLSVEPTAQAAAMTDNSDADDARKSPAPRSYCLPDGVTTVVDTDEDADGSGQVRIAGFFALGNSTGSRIVLKDNREKTREIGIDTITGGVTIVNQR